MWCIHAYYTICTYYTHAHTKHRIIFLSLGTKSRVDFTIIIEKENTQWLNNNQILDFYSSIFWKVFLIVLTSQVRVSEHVCVCVKHTHTHSLTHSLTCANNKRIPSLFIAHRFLFHLICYDSLRVRTTMSIIGSSLIVSAI